MEPLFSVNKQIAIIEGLESWHREQLQACRERLKALNEYTILIKEHCIHEFVDGVCVICERAKPLAIEDVYNITGNFTSFYKEREVAIEKGYKYFSFDGWVYHIDNMTTPAIRLSELIAHGS